MSEAKRPARSMSRPMTPVVDDKPMIALPGIGSGRDEDTDPGIPSPEEGEIKDGAQVFLGMPAGGGDPLVVGGMYSDAVSELEHALGPGSNRGGRNSPGMRLQVVTRPRVDEPSAASRMQIHRKEDLVDSLVEMPAAIERGAYSTDPRFRAPNSRAPSPPVRPPRRMEMSAVDDYRADRIRHDVRPSEPVEEMPPPPPPPWREANQTRSVVRGAREFGRVNAETMPEMQGPVSTAPVLHVDGLNGQAAAPQPVGQAQAVEAVPAGGGLSLSAVFVVAMVGLGIGAAMFYFQPHLLGIEPLPAAAQAPTEAAIDPSAFGVEAPTKAADPTSPKPVVRNPAIRTGVLQVWARNTSKIYVDGEYVGVVEGQGADAGPRTGPSSLPPIELSPGKHNLKAVSRSGTYNATVRIDEGRPSDVVIDVGR